MFELCLCSKLSIQFVVAVIAYTSVLAPVECACSERHYQQITLPNYTPLVTPPGESDLNATADLCRRCSALTREDDDDDDDRAVSSS